MRPAACCRPSARAAAGSRCGRSSAEDVARAAADALAARRRTTPRSRPRPPPPTAASRARSTCSAAPRCRCASGSTRCWRRCRRSIRATCMRSATALGRDETAFAAFVDAVRDWLSARVSVAGRRAAPARAHGRGVGEAQRRGARCRRSTISSESRWFSTCSAGLPQPRAVDTDQRMSEKPRYYITTAIAYPNGRAAYRPRLRGRSRPTRSRASSGSTATTCSSSPAPTSTAARSRRPPRKEGITPQQLVDRNVARFQRDGEAAELLERRVHPHHRAAPSHVLAGDLGADEGERRHLSVEIRRLVLGARRGLLRRERDARRERRARRRARHAGRVGRGGELFLQALGLSGQAAEALRRRAGLRAAARAAQRSRELRARRAAGPVGLAHHLRLGREGAGRREARDVRVGRRADQLHHGGRLSGHRERDRSSATGRPTCT